MINNTKVLNALNSSIRQIEAGVEVQNGTSTFVITSKDKLKSITVERLSESGKFYGFGISLKITIKVIDTNREIDFNHDKIKIFNPYYIIDGEEVYPYPFDLELVSFERDENTNELTIVVSDGIEEATKHTVSEIGEIISYHTVASLAEACGHTFYFGTVFADNVPFDLVHSGGGYGFNPKKLNFDGTETIREALDAIAEYTQTVYYVNTNHDIYFTRLDKDGAPVFTIDKNKYFSLTSEAPRVLQKIVIANELGNNISATTGVEGDTQYIRDNPFYELHNHVDMLINDAIAAVGGFSITPFSCDWRGNYLLEPCDKIAITAKDNTQIITYNLNEVITYDGALHSRIDWSYAESETETEANPVTLGATLKQTYAKVDKANKEIEMVVSDTTALRLDTNGIAATVSGIQDNLNGVEENIDELTSRVNATMTKDEVKIEIEKMTSNVNSVTTLTGFTFNENGMKVSKSNSDITTEITENGMKVRKNNDIVLTADKNGVNAKNLHATTYMLIGKNIRFEDYEEGRTACFWYGGEDINVNIG